MGALHIWDAEEMVAGNMVGNHILETEVDTVDSTHIHMVMDNYNLTMVGYNFVVLGDRQVARMLAGILHNMVQVLQVADEVVVAHFQVQDILPVDGSVAKLDIGSHIVNWRSPQNAMTVVGFPEDTHPSAPIAEGHPKCEVEQLMLVVERH